MKICTTGSVRTLGLLAALILATPSLSSGQSEGADAACGCNSPSCPHCQGCCAECGDHCAHGNLQVCTVMVPACVAETRVKVEVVREPQEIEEKYTVFQLVPKTRKFEREKCYLKQEVVKQDIKEEKCHLVKTPVEQTLNVKTYHPEYREVLDPCGECPPQVCEVMVECIEPRINVCEETKVAFSTTEKPIHYCVLKPETYKVPCAEEKYFELQEKLQTRKVTVCVPRLVRTPYEVIVCKQIPQQILCCPKCAKKHGHH